MGPIRAHIPLTGDEIEWLHLWAGYAIAALVAMRIVWGFIGSRHARFVDFVKGPRAIASFLKQSVRLEAPRYLGHNPAGGAMVIALLVMLVGLSVTGFALTTDAFWGSKMMEGMHEVLANVTLGLVGLHILGVVLVSERARRKSREGDVHRPEASRIIAKRCPRGAV